MTKHYAGVEALASASRVRPLGFDPASAGELWELDDAGSAVRRGGDAGAPATVMGLAGYLGGDRQVRFHILEAPVGAHAQLGLCTIAHLGHERLGWIRSLGVGPDGSIHADGDRVGGSLGRLALGDVVTVRLRNHRAYLRLEPAGAWNGLVSADPLRGVGGIPLEVGDELFPAITSDTPGMEIAADFSGWEGPGAEFDPHPGRSSLAWEVASDRLSAEHVCAEDAPATLLGSPLPRASDGEVSFLLETLPASARVQVGLCGPGHPPACALGGWGSLALGEDGILRQGDRALRRLGALRQGDAVTIRVAGGCAYIRVGLMDFWNGDPTADPARHCGGVPLATEMAFHPAIYAERPGTRVRADFSAWRDWRGTGAGADGLTCPVRAGGWA